MGYVVIDSKNLDAANLDTKSQQPHYGLQQQYDEMMEINGVPRDHSSQIHQPINSGTESHGEEHFPNHAILIEKTAPRECKLEMKGSLIKLRQRHRTLTSSPGSFCLAYRALEAHIATIINTQALKHWETRPGRKPFHDTSQRKGLAVQDLEILCTLARPLGTISADARKSNMIWFSYLEIRGEHNAEGRRPD